MSSSKWKPESRREIQQIIDRKRDLYGRAYEVTKLLYRNKLLCSGSHSPEIECINDEDDLVYGYTQFRDLHDNFKFPLDFLLRSDEEILKRANEVMLRGCRSINWSPSKGEESD
jgi:hypothetical protein